MSSIARMSAAAIVCLSIVAGSSVSAAPAPGWEARLSGNEETGRELVIEGRVLARDGHPLRDVTVHAYHAGADGQYTDPGGRHYRHSGVLRTNVLGEFRVRTSLPGMAEGGPHVHFVVELPGGLYRAIPLNLARSHGAGSDAAYGKLPWMVKLTDVDHWAYVEPSDSNVYRCAWDLKLAKAASVSKPEAFEGR